MRSWKKVARIKTVPYGYTDAMVEISDFFDQHLSG